MAITQTQILNVCISMFNAAPGATNLANLQAWADANTEATTADLATALGDLTEFTSLYTGTDAENAATMAGNFGLTSGTGYDAAVAYFTQELAAGTSKASMLATANDFLLNSDAATLTSFGLTDAATILTNKTTVAEYYSVTKAVSGATIADLQTAVSGVDATSASVTTAQTAVDAAIIADSIDGTTFTLTTSTDSIVGTVNNDLITSADGTLAAADTILDSTTTDADILTIETTSSAGVAARIQNVETINANGTYVNVGYDATNTAGTENLNLSTSVVGGTAAVIGASSINVANINAGNNIATLNVTSAAGGTRDTVNIDAGSATTVTLAGNANGIDKMEATVAAGTTLTVNDAGTLGEYTANVGSTATISTGTGTGIKTFTINTDSASAITVNSVLTSTAANLGNTDFDGAGDVTVTTAVASIDAQAMTSTGAGTLAVVVTDAVAGESLEAIAADTLTLKGATAGVTVNNGSTVNLFDTGSSVIAVNNASASIDVNSDGNYDAGDATSALNVKVSDSQTAMTTGAHVSTLLLEATPDETVDTASGAEITVTNLTTGAQNGTVVISGSENLTISDIDDGADLVVTATEMTGELTIVAADSSTNDQTILGGTADDSLGIDIATGKTGIILGGSGDDTLTATGAGTAVIKLYGDAGDDTITGAAVASILEGGTGADTITGGAAVDTIDGGAGDDIIVSSAGADEITVGTGNDTVIIDSGDDGAVIADAISGTDVVVLTGASNAAATLDVTDLTVASGASTEWGTNHNFTLTDSTATDLSGLVRFGTQATATVAASTYTAAVQDLVAGSLNDHITTSGDAAVNAGAGDDVIVNAQDLTAGTNDLTGGAGSDTFTLSGNSVVTDFGATDILSTTGAKTFGISVIEDFTATADTVNNALSAAVTLTLADGIDVDMTLATLAGATSGYTILTDATAGVVTQGATITGSRGEDVLTGSDYADTITGGEAADTINAGEGADSIILTESVVAIDAITHGEDDSVASSAQTIAAGNGGAIAANDTITFANGVDTITGLGTTDTINGAAVGATLATMIAMTENALTDDVVAFASGDYDAATGIFTVKADGAGSDTLIIDTTEAEDTDIATADSAVILVGTNSADLVAGNFI